MPEHEAMQMHNWVEHISRARTARSWQAVLSLSKLADKKADKYEQEARAQRLKNWRQALSGRGKTMGDKAPTKLAYRWLKGFTG